MARGREARWKPRRPARRAIKRQGLVAEVLVLLEDVEERLELSLADALGVVGAVVLAALGPLFLRGLGLKDGLAEGAAAPPAILTGLPDGGKLAKTVRRQKEEWVLRELGPDVELVACASVDKAKMRGGPRAVLIDDRASARGPGPLGRCCLAPACPPAHPEVA